MIAHDVHHAVERGCECPRCGRWAKLFDYQEVDIGVGVQEFNHEYECQADGRFAFVDGDALFAEDTP